MAKAKSLAPLVLIPFLICIAAAQDVKIISERLPNRDRIVNAWNSINPATQEWNVAMAKAEALLHVRFGNQGVDLNEERKATLELERRKACVGYYKQALNALEKEREALIKLIEEEDY
jgi:hypothetical protein